MRIADEDVLKMFFDVIMNLYFKEIPEGRLKLNLSGLDNVHSHSMTTWEVWKLSTNYLAKTDYYKFENFVPRKLSLSEALPIVENILLNFFLN